MNLNHPWTDTISYSKPDDWDSKTFSSLRQEIQSFIATLPWQFHETMIGQNIVKTLAFTGSGAFRGFLEKELKAALPFEWFATEFVDALLKTGFFVSKPSGIVSRADWTILRQGDSASVLTAGGSFSLPERVADIYAELPREMETARAAEAVAAAMERQEAEGSPAAVEKLLNLFATNGLLVPTRAEEPTAFGSDPRAIFYVDVDALSDTRTTEIIDKVHQEAGKQNFFPKLRALAPLPSSADEMEKLTRFGIRLLARKFDELTWILRFRGDAGAADLDRFREINGKFSVSHQSSVLFDCEKRNESSFAAAVKAAYRLDGGLLLKFDSENVSPVEIRDWLAKDAELRVGRRVVIGSESAARKLYAAGEVAAWPKELSGQLLSGWVSCKSCRFKKVFHFTGSTVKTGCPVHGTWKSGPAELPPAVSLQPEFSLNRTLCL